MQTTILQTFGPSTVMYRTIITASDVAAGANNTTTTVVLNLPMQGVPFGGAANNTVPKATIVKMSRVKHAVAFSGTSITNCNVCVGSAAGANNWIAANFNCVQAVADTTQLLTSVNNAATYAVDTLQATFTTVGANCSALNNGTVNIDLELWFEPDLTATAALTNTPTAQGSGGGLL